MLFRVGIGERPSSQEKNPGETLTFRWCFSLPDAILMTVNFKLTSACIASGAMALATSVQALTSAPPANVSADDNSNPYAVIMDRNVFRLNPIPPPPPPVEQKPKDLPKVYLSGIVKVGDDLRVLFSTPAKDKTPATYFKLAVGEKDGELELVKVHPDEQKVDVIVGGTPMTLSMLTDTLTATGSKGSGEAPAPGPGRPGFGRLRQGNALQATPPPAPAAAAASRESSAVIVGGERDSSSYGGGTMVAGGGGVTTIGGGNSGSSFGGGTMVGGGGGTGISSLGSGSSYGSGTMVSGGAVNTPGSQIANALLSGGQGSAQVENTPTQPALSPEQQALNMAAYAQLHPDGPPMLPPVQAAVDGQPYNPRGNK